jgi:hypothetical protein
MQLQIPIITSIYGNKLQIQDLLFTNHASTSHEKTRRRCCSSSYPYRYNCPLLPPIAAETLVVYNFDALVVVVMAFGFYTRMRKSQQGRRLFILNNLLVGSNENARTLLEKDPGNISRYLAKGNERVRASFIAAVSWLAAAALSC